MFPSYLLMFCRMAIALVFIFSASGKFLALADFEVAIGDFKLLPHRWSKKLAVIFLGEEIGAATFVSIGGGFLPIGFLLALSLLAVFSIALLMALQRNIDLSCNCFGRTQRHISLYDVGRNALLILCCLLGLWMLKYTRQNLTGGEIVLLTLMSAVFAMLVTNLDTVVETLRKPLPISTGDGGEPLREPFPGSQGSGRT